MAGRIPKTGYHLILDMDETFVHTIEVAERGQFKKLEKEIDRLNLDDPKNFELKTRTYYLYGCDIATECKGAGADYHIFGIRRPHLDRFFEFAFQYFRSVSVWSAGKHGYVHLVLDRVMRGKYRPKEIFTYNECRTENRCERKLLSKMLRKTDIASEYSTLEERLQHVVIIDDKAETFSGNAANGILIPPYQPKMTLASLYKDDQALPQLMDWLMCPEVIEADNIKELDKGSIFY